MQRILLVIAALSVCPLGGAPGQVLFAWHDPILHELRRGETDAAIH